MKNTKKVLFYSFIIFSALNCHFCYASEAPAGTISMIAGKTIDGLSTACPYISVAVQAYTISDEIRKHTYPNEEERAHAQAVGEGHARITAENEFQSCMMKNRRAPERGSSGRPTACEDIASMLIMLGGGSEAQKITAIYNQVRNNN